MPEWPSSGGGSAIYKSGDPVSIHLSFESTTVPDGETWVVTIQANTSDADSSAVNINGGDVAAGTNNTTLETVLSGGDTIEIKETDAHIGGWSV